MVVAGNSFATPSFSPPGSRWQRLAAYLVRRRVRISVIVFVALVIEDVLVGIRPNNLLDPRDPESMLAVALVVAGLSIRSWAAGILQKSRRLATTGPYALCRNPLYLGSFLIMSGFCFAIDDPENIFVVLGPIAGLYILQVLHEERVLGEAFGDQWRAYVGAVPRLFPRGFRHVQCGPWQLGQWLGSREYRAVLAVLSGLSAIEVWHFLRR